MLRKAVIIADKALDKVILVVSLLFFLICFYAMFDAAMVYYNANSNAILKYKPKIENAGSLKEISQDAVAWLTVDDTNIDYPVMQGADNAEYLNKDPFGKYSLSGSIFLDCRCAADFTDPYSVVYGHHMDYNSMFGALDKYKEKQGFFEKHRTGTLITAAGRGYSIRFFACLMAPATDEVLFDPDSATLDALRERLRSGTLKYYEEDFSGEANVIALSTCQAADNIERLLILGELTEIQN